MPAKHVLKEGWRAKSEKSFFHLGDRSRVSHRDLASLEQQGRPIGIAKFESSSLALQVRVLGWLESVFRVATTTLNSSRDSLAAPPAIFRLFLEGDTMSSPNGRAPSIDERVERREAAEVLGRIAKSLRQKAELAEQEAREAELAHSIAVRLAAKVAIYELAAD